MINIPTNIERVVDSITTLVTKDDYFSRLENILKDLTWGIYKTKKQGQVLTENAPPKHLNELDL